MLNAGSMSAFKRRRAQFETPHCPSCDSSNVVTDNRQGTSPPSAQLREGGFGGGTVLKC